MVQTDPTKRILLSLFTALAWCIGCHQRVFTLEYIVPDGYRGLIVFSREPTGPEDTSRSNDWVNVHIPSNGVCFSRSALPSHQPHFLRARYANGDTLPINGSTKVPDNLVAFRRLPARANEPEKEYIVIGTKDDAVEALTKVNGFSWK